MRVWRGLACAWNNLPVLMTINYAFDFQKGQLHDHHAVVFPKKKKKFSNYLYIFFLDI